MSAFADAQHAASWAGLCPGNRESGGKQLSQRTRKGNCWLRRALCQSAWAVSHKKDCYLTAYHVLGDGTVCQERGGGYFDQLHPERACNRLLRRLGRLGWDVSITPRTPAAPDS
jgi:transposase